MECHRCGAIKQEVSVIGEGIWCLERGDCAAAIAALRLGIDLGMRHIDTAESYGGASSRRWSARRSPGAGTDWLDCYLLHWRGKYPLAETDEAFEELQRDGKILSWGVGNFDQAIADAHGATPRRVALRFLVRRHSLFTIPKASRPKHVAENAGAARGYPGLTRRG